MLGLLVFLSRAFYEVVVEGAELPFDKANGDYVWHSSTVYRQEAGHAIIRRAGAAWHLVVDSRDGGVFNFTWAGSSLSSTAMVWQSPCGKWTCTVRKERFAETCDLMCQRMRGLKLQSC